MEMEVGTNGRGARRKKIVERGSDRLALITGRIHALDPPPPNNNNEDHSSIHHSHTKSSPVFLSNHHVGGGGEQDVGDGGNAVYIGSKVEPQMRKCERNTKAIRGGAVAVEFGDKVAQLPPVTAAVPKASDDVKEEAEAEPEPPSESSGAGNYFFTPKEISCCILATENTRVLCSIMIALLVILSYVNLPGPKNIIASRPLYVLLLTDFSIVIGLLFLEKRRGSEKAKEEEEEEVEDEHNWGGAVTVLELGLVLHQALRAIFIDCSFYVVMVVCGFSIM